MTPVKLVFYLFYIIYMFYVFTYSTGILHILGIFYVFYWYLTYYTDIFYEGLQFAQNKNVMRRAVIGSDMILSIAALQFKRPVV